MIIKHFIWQTFFYLYQIGKFFFRHKYLIYQCFFGTNEELRAKDISVPCLDQIITIHVLDKLDRLLYFCYD